MTFQRITGGFLVAGFITVLVGALMFVGRGGLKDARSPAGTYLIWERSFIMLAVILTAVGFVLMERLLETHGEELFARIGSTAFLLAAVLLVIAEVVGLRRGEPIYGLIFAYVVLAFIGQAVLGVSMLGTDLLPRWIGWAAIAWSLGWLALLVIVSTGDVYFPVLHHVIPLAVGVSLLTGR